MMKNLLSRFFRRRKDEDNLMIAYPKLDEPLTFGQVTERSMAGWIAYQLAGHLNENKMRRDNYFLSPFINKSYYPEDSQTKKIRLLSHSASRWIREDLFIDAEIEKLDLDPALGKALRRIIREIQSEKSNQEQTDVDHKSIWKVYRDVIYSASQGRFLLVEKQDLFQYKSGILLCESDIKKRSDIPLTRDLATTVFEQLRLKPSKVMRYKLMVSEAVTNVLKHAEYGKLFIYKDELTGTLRIVVEDIGKGFPLHVLPQTTLMAGFSTKNSLGQGFNLMLKMADQLVLETSNEGSTLIIILKEESENVENSI